MNATKENNPRTAKEFTEMENIPVTTPGRRPKEVEERKSSKGSREPLLCQVLRVPERCTRRYQETLGNGNTGRGAEGRWFTGRRRPDLAIAQTNADLMLMSDEWLSQNIGLQHWHWAVGRKNDVVVKSKRLLRQLIRQPITAKRLPFFSPRPTRFENSKA
ncbi:hypothetical protein B0H13DRAFT_1922277 [Mycena leptocephala]|nr:hypothetical protein B0H13DRAFT_1922277 [Mycena leptocephala]